MEALGWGTKTLIFFHDRVTFSLRSRSATLATFATTFVPGSSYFVLKTKPFSLLDNLGITDTVSRLSCVSLWFKRVGLPVSSLLFAASTSSTLLLFAAHSNKILLRHVRHAVK